MCCVCIALGGVDQMIADHQQDLEIDGKSASAATAAAGAATAAAGGAGSGGSGGAAAAKPSGTASAAIAGTGAASKETEHKLKYTAIHRECVNKFEASLEKFITDRGVSVEDFFKMCQTANSLGDPNMV